MKTKSTLNSIQNENDSCSSPPKKQNSGRKSKRIRKDPQIVKHEEFDKAHPSFLSKKKKKKSSQNKQKSDQQNMEEKIIQRSSFLKKIGSLQPSELFKGIEILKTSSDISKIHPLLDPVFNENEQKRGVKITVNRLNYIKSQVEKSYNKSENNKKTLLQKIESLEKILGQDEFQMSEREQISTKLIEETDLRIKQFCDKADSSKSKKQKDQTQKEWKQFKDNMTQKINEIQEKLQLQQGEFEAEIIQLNEQYQENKKLFKSNFKNISNQIENFDSVIAIHPSIKIKEEQARFFKFSSDNQQDFLNENVGEQAIMMKAYDNSEEKQVSDQLNPFSSSKRNKDQFSEVEKQEKQVDDINLLSIVNKILRNFSNNNEHIKSKYFESFKLIKSRLSLLQNKICQLKKNLIENVLPSISKATLLFQDEIFKKKTSKQKIKSC